MNTNSKPNLIPKQCSNNNLFHSPMKLTYKKPSPYQTGYVLGFLLFFCAFTVLAQDTIALKIGIKIPAEVLYFDGDTISYKFFENVESQKLLRVLNSEVLYIRYSNGRVKSFAQIAEISGGMVFITAGAGASSVNVLESNYRTVLGLNYFAGYSQNCIGPRKRFGWESSLGYVEKGGVIDMNGVPLYLVSNRSLISNSYSSQNVKMGYISGDALLRYCFAKVGYLKAGLEVGYLQKLTDQVSDALEQNSGPLEDPYKVSDFRRLSVAAEYGLGINVKGKRVGIFAECVFRNDLTDIGLRAPTENGLDGRLYRNSCAFFNVGVFFHLKKNNQTLNK
jgi:hypothetical protein